MAAAAAAPQASIPIGRLARLGDQPEAVAADPVHVGIDHRDGGRGRDHGLDGVAAFPQHRQAGLCREVMGGHDHATAG